MENNSIEMKIAKIAASNWGQQEPTTIEEAKGITWGSEVVAINGMARVLKLDSEDVEKLVGTKEQDGEIYTQEVISEDIASKIRSAISRSDKNESVLEILSTIHDEWVKNNSNNFLKVNDKGERRNKERQFVPLELLDWGEVQSALLFLKPILEASGIELDEKELRDRFEVVQQEFLIDNGITSHEKLVEFLSKGAKSYPALEGIETKFGGNIEQLLKDPTVLEEMAGQIESRVKIKSEKEMAKNIFDSKNPEMDEVFWADTRVDNPTFSEEKCPRINGPISRREILLSKTIGMPYPKYITSGISDHNHDEYSNEIRRPRDSEWDIVDRYQDTLDDRVESIRTQSLAAEVKEILLQGDDTIGIALSTKGGYEPKKNNPENLIQRIEKAMPKKMFDLGKRFGIGFPSDITHHQRGQGGGYTYKAFETEFIYVGEESPDWQKEEVAKRQKKLSQFQEKVLGSTDGKYDRKGSILIPKYSTNTGYEYEPNETGEKPKAWTTDFIEIEMTQRELAEAGILPEDFKWIEKARVSAKDIADADREQALTTTEVGGFKGFMKKLLDKIKGIGEK